MEEPEYSPDEDIQEMGIAETPKIENTSDLIKFLTKPARVKGSKYHLYIPNLAIGYLERNDIDWIMWDIRAINQLLSIGQYDIANKISTELVTKFEGLRAKNGFERIKQTTVTHNISKHVSDGSKKSSFFRGGGDQE